METAGHTEQDLGDNNRSFRSVLAVTNIKGPMQSMPREKRYSGFSAIETHRPFKRPYVTFQRCGAQIKNVPASKQRKSVIGVKHAAKVMSYIRDT